MSFFSNLFGSLIQYLCNITGSYGLALILFTIIVRICMTPLSLILYKESLKLLNIQEDLTRIKIRFFGDNEKINENTLKLYKENHYHPMLQMIPLLIQIILLFGVLEVVYNPGQYITLSTVFAGIDLSVAPIKAKGVSLLSAVLTGLSAALLYFVEDRINPVQRTSDKKRRYGNIIFSILLALWLGFFAPAGAGLYWITGNLFATVSEFVFHRVFKPEETIDIDRINQAKEELTKLESQNHQTWNLPLYLRSKKDYRRFLNISGKHLVFYSEGDGFYKYYAGMIEYLIKYTNIPIHYITSDPEDSIFERAQKEDGFYTYFIDQNTLIPLMMKMEADVVVMTMPDLDNFHIKKSYICDNIEYVNVCHGIGSYNLTFRKGAVDHFDTLFLAGPHQTREIRQMEGKYNLPEKKIIDAGYPLLDEMIRQFKKNSVNDGSILIAPSWHDGNIMESCIEELVNQLSSLNRKIIIRPHPQYVRNHSKELDELKNKLSSIAEIHDNFSSDEEILKADLLITDWSSIAFEYAFTTKRPVLFVDTPMKIMNPDYEDIKEEPFDIKVRNQIGKSISIQNINHAKEYASELLRENKKYEEAISSLMDESVYNIGSSSAICGRYLAETVISHNKERNKK